MRLLGQSWDFEMAVSPVLGECISEHGPCTSTAPCAGAAWLSSCDPRSGDIQGWHPGLWAAAQCRRDRAALTWSEMMLPVPGQKWYLMYLARQGAPRGSLSSPLCTGQCQSWAMCPLRVQRCLRSAGPVPGHVSSCCPRPDCCSVAENFWLGA